MRGKWYHKLHHFYLPTGNSPSQLMAWQADKAIAMNDYHGSTELNEFTSEEISEIQTN